MLRLAFEGLWWRRGVSVLLLVVAAFTTTAAAAAASYADSARDAVLQAALRRAPVGSRGTGVQATVELAGRPSASGLQAAVGEAFDGAAHSAYPTVVMQLSVLQRIPADTGTPSIALVERDGFCRAVRISAGTCVSEADRTGVVVEQATARAHGLHVGSRITVVPLHGGGSSTGVVVRGIAVRRDRAASYWFAGDADPSQDALPVWAPQSYFSALDARPGDGVTATADLLLDERSVHVRSIAGLERALDHATSGLQAGPSSPTVTTGLEQVVRDGLEGGSRLTIPIVVTIAEFLALGWYLLHTLIGGAAEARGAEVALSKVRGMTGGRTLLLILLEPALLLGAAVPLGVVLASAAEHSLVPPVLGTAVDVHLGWTSWAAAVGAAGGGLVAAAAASVTVFRRPVLEQWRRTSRLGSRRGVVVEAATVVLAIAGIVQLRLSGALGAGTASGIAVLAPMLLLVAGALVASRAVVLLARVGFGATRATGAVAAFVGLRQLVRRPAGRRTFGVLVVAVALAMYGLSSAAVLAQNRDERALTDTGAPVVLHIRPDPRTEQRIRSVDRTGRRVTAVADVPIRASTTYGVFDADSSTSADPSMLVVDPRTFGSVAYWRSDFSSSPLARLMRPLRSPAPLTPRVTGTTLTTTVAAQTVPSSLTLAVDLVDQRGALVTATLGTLRSGTTTYQASVDACADGCQLRRIYVTRPSDQVGPLVARFTVRDARVLSGGSSGSVQPSLAAVRWSPLNPIPGGQVGPAETVHVAPDGLDVTIAVSGAPNEDVPGFGVVAGAVDRLPALVAAGLRGDTASLLAQSPDGAVLQMRPVGRVAVVPRLGNAGVVVARDWVVAASPSGSTHALANQVWVAGDAPVDTVRRLRASGIRVLAVDRATHRSADLASEGPAFASALVLAAGVAAVLLAAAAVVLGLVLLARRRVFELSAMRALGIRRRSLLGSVMVEQGALIVVAAVSGLVLGLLSAQLALPALPAYVDDPPYPAFLVDQPLGLLLSASGGVVALLLVAVGVTAAVLTRSASVTRLREAEQ